MKNQETTVELELRRHAKKGNSRFEEKTSNDLSVITDQGRDELQQMAKNLNGDYDAFYCSEMYRALESLVIICGILPKRNSGKQIRIHTGLGYLKAPDLDKYLAALKSSEELAKSENREANYADFARFNPGMSSFLRDQLTATLLDIAIQVASENDKQTVKVLAVSHGTAIESAAIDCSQIPILKECDAVRYTIAVVGANARIIKSEFISRGF